MNCGDTLTTTEGEISVVTGEQLDFDAGCELQLVLTWNGKKWNYWCSKTCALFELHSEPAPRR